jgi:phage N-6-adenine-methyltransferase
MDTEVMFSSKTDLWATPLDFFQRLDAAFRFELDVCALPTNAKCPRYFTPDDDGLAQDWRGTCWMNPPYGREIGAWIEKAYRSAKDNGATVVCLVPARVDTRWWHDYCARGEVHFVKGRLKFGDSPNAAPFPNAVVVFRPTVADALEREPGWDLV